MKLAVTIKAGKVTQKITLPVGKGTQTIKWLASAVAYRFVHDGARGGRPLPNRGRYTLPQRTQLLPKDVYTEECPFLHPHDVIKDHLSDGQTVVVDLYLDELPLDEYGIPVLSPWAFIAFCHDERHAEKRDKLIEEKKLEVETFKREKETQAMIAKMNIEKPKISLMQKVMAAQLLSDTTIAATFNEEWGLIKNSGILDNIVPDEKQQEEIRSFFLKYFVELNDMYKFYSAVNSGGGTHTLEYIELSKFLTETGILGEEHSNAILRIFVDSHIRTSKSKGVRPSIHSEIRRHEFFVALVKIAILKNITIRRKEISKLRKKGHQVSVAKAKVPSPPEALEMIYEEFLSPVLDKMPAGCKMRAAVGSDSVMILFYDNLTQLAECFEKYAEESSEEGLDDGLPINRDGLGELSMIPTGSMTVHEFGKFATDTGFVDSNENIVVRNAQGRKHSIMGNRFSSSVTQKDVRQIFSASQHDSDEPNETEQKKVADDDNLSSHHELMIFSEFLEAVARLGVLKYHFTHRMEEQEEVLSHYECIERAVIQVVGG
mmetsp:Transcript_9929/g.21489  ORF Transcript_9929/g.21489 Transcript_9929/m.21489 type:complete len:545 (+) Transcript_9929:163-1797(+)